MDKNYDQTKESEIYKKWEDSGSFEPNGSGKPYVILMPPPNANASLHTGHAMYTVDDVMIRFKRMQGYSAEWLPGADHAGIETQFVYEKQLAKEGKSRMDFDRQTLYNNIYKFVQDNSGQIYNQFKRLGFSANWRKSVYTLDKPVLDRVWKTFTKMENEGLIYKGNYIVNYCTYCGTSLAELEIEHEERVDPFFYIRYGPFVIGTVRPETKFRDTALAVNPKDKRYKEYIGKTLEITGLLGPITMKVIPDPEVDPDFGTGIMKVTPAHDAHDFELGKLHNLPVTPIITLQGRMDFTWFINDPNNKQSKYLDRANKYHGLKVAEARKIMIEDLKADGLLEKIDEKYTHNVSLCYKCKRVLEPSVIPNWYIKVDSLKKPVIASVKKDEVNFYPHRFKKHMLDWLSIMHDWPISRQNAWGIRIPVWYSVKENPDMSVAFLNSQGKYTFGVVSELLNTYSFTEIESGLQTLRTGQEAKYLVSTDKPYGVFLQETDTFDTWFSSGHWPIVTGANLPTAMLGTLADILRFWVSRMIMFSLYLNNKIPFKDVYLWSMVADAKGTKMSKSKGNVVNPIELIDKYGADALRMTLLYGIAPGGTISLSEDKVRGMRNFSNKLWNIARFVSAQPTEKSAQNKNDSEILKKLKKITSEVTKHLDKYQFGLATEKLYAFIWHEVADIYLEKVKAQKANGKTLELVLDTCLKLLHPFMPFVTESIWQELGHTDLLISASWPK